MTKKAVFASAMLVLALRPCLGFFGAFIRQPVGSKVKEKTFQCILSRDEPFSWFIPFFAGHSNVQLSLTSMLVSLDWLTGWSYIGGHHKPAFFRPENPQNSPQTNKT